MGTLKDLLGEIKDINEEDPYIDEHLKPAVANEFGSVTFDAKVDGDNFSATWYKNGEEIHRHPRYRTSVRRCWYTLKIRDLKKTDSGIYTVVCRNNSSYATSQATLHVIPEKRPGINGANIGTGFFRPRPQLWIEITHHLRCLTVQRGDPILLRVEIRKHPDAQPSFSWYKNNRVSNPVADESTEAVGDDNSFAEYVKYNSEVTDSGIYTVLISNDEIVLSSSAEVVVMDPDFQHDELILNIGNPCFIQPLPDELDVFETEEVTMLCKTLLEMSTELYFFKDEKKLEGDDNITFGEYEGRGLIINIKRATVKDSGIYNVVIRNKDNKRIANTQCILTVNPAPQERIPQVNLVEPLTIVISSIGHKVCLRCTFNMPKTDLFYVVWRVGFYEIERDTPQFKLISNEDGIYSIMIKALDPDMFGEVTCQLRYMIPTKNSIQVAITKGLLIQVPPEDLQEDVQDMLEKSSVVTVEMDFNRSAVVYRAASDDTPQREHHHRHQDLKVTFHPDGDDEGKQDEAVALPEPVPKEYATLRRKFCATKANGTLSDILMEITYCRLKDDNAHFLALDSCFRSPLLVMADLKTNKNIQHELVKIYESEIVEIEWLDGSARGIDNWYAIDTKQACGEYCMTGITSDPKLTICNPRSDQIIKFRIRVIDDALESIPEASFVIFPPRAQNDRASLAPHRPVEEFRENYTRIGEPMGIGAYGAVYLVQAKNDRFLAAKIVKTRTEKRRQSTRREIEIMKQLHHRRIVHLHASYYSRDQMIIVMDYLWGGELFERIVEEDNFKERTAVHYIQQICEGLEYLHSRSIVHLDVKPENVVCTSRNSRNIKIVDFGLSRVLENDMVRAIYGTRDYIAPEVLSFEAIQPASDMWSLGVVTYVMLSGTIPFTGNNWAERAAAITMGDFNFKDPAFDTITDEAKTFISSLLKLKPEDRLTAQSAQQHPWMLAETVDDFGVGQTQRWRMNLKTYLETNKARWQRAGNVVIAANRLLTGAQHTGTKPPTHR